MTLRCFVCRHSLDVGERRRDVLRRVRLAGQEQVEPGVRIRGDPEDHPLDRGRAEEEILVRGELDELARHAAAPSDRGRSRRDAPQTSAQASAVGGSGASRCAGSGAT